MKRSAQKVTPVGEENGAGNGCCDCNPVLANATQQPGRSRLQMGCGRGAFLVEPLWKLKEVERSLNRKVCGLAFVGWKWRGFPTLTKHSIKEVSLLAWEKEKRWKKSFGVLPVALIWKPKPQWSLSLPALFWTFVCHQTKRLCTMASKWPKLLEAHIPTQPPCSFASCKQPCPPQFWTSP